MSTPAITYLTERGARFEVVEYAHEEKGALFASEAIGFPLERTVKTLIVDAAEKGYAAVLLPGHMRLSPRRLSRVLGAKRAAMADHATAERLTGYKVGGISPFGTRRRLKVLMEACLLTLDRVAVNGGRRGLMVVMDPKEIVRVTGCLPASIGE